MSWAMVDKLCSIQTFGWRWVFVIQSGVMLLKEIRNFKHSNLGSDVGCFCNRLSDVFVVVTSLTRSIQH
ncbi:hypothetical protein M758_10G006400 [Ceratodon purpureus]|nr:hypothetical protein M758_10G006400 [Ceratodon purpureus]